MLQYTILILLGNMEAQIVLQDRRRINALKLIFTISTAAEMVEMRMRNALFSHGSPTWMH